VPNREQELTGIIFHRDQHTQGTPKFTTSDGLKSIQNNYLGTVCRGFSERTRLSPRPDNLKITLLAEYPFNRLSQQSVAAGD
jgi:hypothetical protein